MRLDDFRQSLVVIAELSGFAQQLGGMAHRADRVPDFVCDAGAEATQGRQLRLLHPCIEYARVLDKDKNRTAAIAPPAERCQVRCNACARTLIDQRKLRVRRQGGILAPAAQVVG